MIVSSSASSRSSRAPWSGDDRFSLALSFWRPLWVIIFVVIFDLYWLFRVLYYIPFILLAWWRYRDAVRTDWQARLERLPGWERVVHLVFLPTYKEDLGVVRETLRRLAKSPYPAKRIMVVLAGEERDRERFERIVSVVSPEFEGSSVDFRDPPSQGSAGRSAGQGSNLNFAGYQVLAEIEAMGIPFDDIVVSSFDVDTLAHPQYLSNLAYLYLTVPEPTRSSTSPSPSTTTICGIAGAGARGHVRYDAVAHDRARAA